ncbi:uncharacterized protein VTP21DRAFT_3082 [Calcarisporiella thermophila]|uniref:uncharacterized protein n=1 Tax=Calcarisporiella thermophila TaxID=911321 RepID=UPI0037431643
MNILPHKSWHVYNVKNREKVRKDEEEAAEEERKKAERVLIAEREARLNLLRERAQQKNQLNAPPSHAEASRLVGEGALTTSAVSREVEEEGAPARHINFWEDLEKAENAAATAKLENPEAEEEERAKKEKLARQMNMYLDKDSKAQKPWWMGAERDDQSKPSSGSHHSKGYKSEKKDEYSKKRHDPLTKIKDILEKKEEKKHKDSRRMKDKSRVHKRDKHSSSSSHSTSSKSLEELRAERLARERAERERAYQLIHGRTSPEPEEAPIGKYNSQFNPDLTSAARQQWQERRNASKRHRYSDKYRS